MNEENKSVDNLGGILSVVLVGALVLALNFPPVAELRTLASHRSRPLTGLVLFLFRQRRAKNPLYDLKIAARPTFWVAAVGGIIVFGS